MASDRRLAGPARRMHTIAEKLWIRITESDDYDIKQKDVDEINRLSWELRKAVNAIKKKKRT